MHSHSLLSCVNYDQSVHLEWTHSPSSVTYIKLVKIINSHFHFHHQNQNQTKFTEHYFLFEIRLRPKTKKKKKKKFKIQM